MMAMRILEVDRRYDAGNCLIRLRGGRIRGGVTDIDGLEHRDMGVVKDQTKKGRPDGGL
jgi:shikimate 5-dehydrogenase